MSFSPSTISDVVYSAPDPRYNEWDKRSRTELGDRLYEAVDKRRVATEELIPRVIRQQLTFLGVNKMTNNVSLNYHISAQNVIKPTRKSIDTQISDWKGLRWWLFNKKNACDSWTKWFKKAKCWQDQNQYKPLGLFWCLIFDELQQYTLTIARDIFSNNMDTIKQQSIHKCLYTKCIESILKGQVRFERTRETPLFSVRLLAQSKQIQQKLKQIDKGFTLLIWKKEAEKEHKKQKLYREYQQQKHTISTTKNRANVATLLSIKCLEYVTNAYHKAVKSLKQIIPSLDIDTSAIAKNQDNHNKKTMKISKPKRATTDRTNRMDRIQNNGYNPSRGGSSNILRAESQRYSPMLSSNSVSNISSTNISFIEPQRYSPTLSSDAVSVGSRSSAQSEHYHHNERAIYSIPTPTERLSQENDELKRELAAMKAQLTLIQQMTIQQQHINQMMMTTGCFTPNRTQNISSNIPPSIGYGNHNNMRNIYSSTPSVPYGDYDTFTQFGGQYGQYDAASNYYQF